MLTTLLAASSLITIPYVESAPATPSYDHTINNILNFCEDIELEDGSHWQVAPPDVYKVVGWKPNETVIVTPNRSWFSFYSSGYYLTNTTQDSYVRVNLTGSPVPFGPVSHWVTSMDKYNGFLFFDNGSCWKISVSDLDLFQSWSINDYVIFGYNDEWLASTDYILINVRLKNHVRANPY
jgi:hypothetical protein